MFGEGIALKKLGNYAFCWCTNLRNIQFPDGLEAIGIGCFFGSGLKEVVLPASVNKVGADAFRKCE